MIKIKRGLNLPLSGAPQAIIEPASKVRQVALLGCDYHGLKPTMAVQVGDRVQLGQLLFTDKKNPNIAFTAPAAGTVVAINRGEQRVLQSVVIEVQGDQAVEFEHFDAAKLPELDELRVRQLLQQSGLWTALRTRPFGKVPAFDAKPSSIFVTAIDTHPLAADPALIINERPADFANGLAVLGRLGKIWLCTGAQVTVPGSQQANVTQVEFSGVHPAGLPGTHIHFLDPVSSTKTVWQIGYQDVLAIGALFTSGRLNVERVIALGGPVAQRPRLLRTRLGASTVELTQGELSGEHNRVISGSVLGGRTARGPYAFLGRYHQQLSCLHEGRERELLHYLRAGVNKHSVLNIFISKLWPSKLLAMDTSTNGSPRAMVPVGNYEAVMPLDILATQLLRYLIVGDTEMAQKLGALELDEEDLALCSYVCAGKYEYGPILRDNLERIEKEG